MLLNHTASWGIACLLLLSNCQSPATKEVQIPEVSVEDNLFKPEMALDHLFHEVQMASVFEDSKTFVDSRPLSPPQEILERYQQEQQDAFNLKDFIHGNFEVPVTQSVAASDESRPMIDHLNHLWSTLTRTPDERGQLSSLIPLPNPYVVPGGRFREVYYWDSYFTMLGLLESAEDSLMLSMMRNFAYLIDEYGFIPNGNRSYYLGRSQPPFFSCMIMLWAEKHGEQEALPFLPQMIKEHEFWMEGAGSLSEELPAQARVVRLADGTLFNRFWDNFAAPRPESYKEDFELAQNYPDHRRGQVYRDLRAGAESGWDYSSRWFSDGASLDSIITTQIAPVDLNCLMYFMEQSIAHLSRTQGDTQTADRFQQYADQRAEAINTYFWDDERGYYSDYNLTQGKTTKEYSAAGMMPLFFQIASQRQASRSADFLQDNLLFPGGVVSTTRDTGQQWDYPNGWAPQQWIAIKGLRNYAFNDMADDISRRWLNITEKVYQNTGKMMEKYNVVDLSLDAGGGEYPTQDGFGWTNGVTLRLNSTTDN